MPDTGWLLPDSAEDSPLLTADSVWTNLNEALTENGVGATTTITAKVGNSNKLHLKYGPACAAAIPVGAPITRIDTYIILRETTAGTDTTINEPFLLIDDQNPEQYTKSGSDTGIDDGAFYEYAGDGHGTIVGPYNSGEEVDLPLWGAAPGVITRDDLITADFGVLWGVGKFEAGDRTAEIDTAYLRVHYDSPAAPNIADPGATVSYQINNPQATVTT